MKRSRLLLLVSIGLIASNVFVISMAAAQGCVSSADIEDAFFSFSGEVLCGAPGDDLEGGGGSGGVGCLPAVGSPCVASVCETYIEDDSVYVNGLIYSSDIPARPPVTADVVAVADGFLEWSLDNSLIDVRASYQPTVSFSSLPTGQFSPSGQWLECFERTTAVEVDVVGVTDVVQGDSASTFVPVGNRLVDPQALLARAMASLDPPAPPVVTAPPKDGDLFVKIPAWFWLEPGYWRPYTSSARDGRLVVTVTAEPVVVLWDPGDLDSDVIACERADMVAWSNGLDPMTGSGCMHLYEHSSVMNPDDKTHIETTVVFEANWTLTFDAPAANPLRDGGYVGSDTRSSTTTVEVKEIQAVLTGTG